MAAQAAAEEAAREEERRAREEERRAREEKEAAEREAEARARAEAQRLEDEAREASAKVLASLLGRTLPIEQDEKGLYAFKWSGSSKRAGIIKSFADLGEAIEAGVKNAKTAGVERQQIAAVELRGKEIAAFRRRLEQM